MVDAVLLLENTTLCDRMGRTTIFCFCCDDVLVFDIDSCMNAFENGMKNGICDGVFVV